MDRTSLFQHAADAVLLLHFGVVLFVVGGLLMVWLGHWRGWRWARSPAFRWLHLVAIAVVVAESWLGIPCPLTTLEDALRRMAGQAGPGAGFIEHWVQRLLFWQAPAWVFTVAYTAFGALVALSWWWCPPRRFRGPGRFRRFRRVSRLPTRR